MKNVDSGEYEKIKGAWYIDGDNILIQRQDDTFVRFLRWTTCNVSKIWRYPYKLPLTLDKYLKVVHAKEMCKAHDGWGMLDAILLHSWGFEKEGWAQEQAAPERKSRDDYER